MSDPPRKRMCDVVVAGGGHNGLVASAYLAAAGLKVTVLERRAVVGGAAATEEFHPGFRNSVAAYAVSLLHPTIIRDLDLARHGLRIVRAPARQLPSPARRPLSEGRARADEGRGREVLGPRRRAARRLRGAARAHGRHLTRARRSRRRPMWRRDAGSRRPARAARCGAGRQPPASARNRGPAGSLEIFARSAGDFLDQWFDSDPIKALLGFDGIVGTYASPYAAGTAYVLLHHCFGEVNGRKGVWGHAIGGMGAITQAMARACASRGVDIRTNAAVARNSGRERPRRRRRHRQGRNGSRRARVVRTSIRS